MKSFFAFVALLLASSALADETYLGLYLQGTKIGHASYLTRAMEFQGGPVTLSQSATRMGMGLLGTPMTIETRSSTWTRPDGTPIRMTFSMTSAGRTHGIEAHYGATHVEVDVENNGERSRRRLEIPKDAKIVDDPIQMLLTSGAAAGASRSFYVLDPNTVSFVKNEVRLVGPQRTTVRDREVDATLVEIIDPRASMKVFVSAKGDLLRVLGPMGIEMLPESREEALAGSDGAVPAIDLAYATSLKLDRPLPNPPGVTSLKLRLSGRDFGMLPSDAHQTVTREGEKWLLHVHPVRVAELRATPIAEAARAKPEWVEPALHMPSDSETFRKLASEIVGDAKDVRGASLAVRRYVQRHLRANAGIGVLRDASEVLKSREGVCRDHAILTGTLLRAAGIPTRLVSGLVNWDGDFFYHAWVEVWDGHTWVALDSTAERDQVTGTHVKLAQGNVDTAFLFPLLENVKLELVEARRD
jgi:hypothetical protein